MKKRWVMVIIFPLLVAICGLTVMWQVSSMDYESLQLEYSSVLNDWAALTEENEALETNLDSITFDYAKIEQEFDALRSKHDSLITQYTELEIERAQLVVARDKLDTKGATLIVQRNTLMEELSWLKSVYPPRHFYSYDELQGWVLVHYKTLQSHTLKSYDLYEAHLELQELALADGYIWSVTYQETDDFIIVGSIAFAGNDIYSIWDDGNIEKIGWR